MNEAAYRETISRPAEANFTHKTILGIGGGEFARVAIRLEPNWWTLHLPERFVRIAWKVSNKASERLRNPARCVTPDRKSC